MNRRPRCACAKRFPHDLRGDAADLDVHLQRRDAVSRSGDFEIHIAVVIFRAGDVGQDGVIVAFFHQSHRNSSYRRLQRYACIHQRKRRAANRGHRGRSVRLQDVGDHAHRVRPVFFVGSIAEIARSASAPCPISRRPAPRKNCNFAHREWREIVMQHEALLGFAFEDFEALHVVAGAQGRRHQSLGFAASEDRGSVRARQHADFDPDVANLIERAAIGTAFLARSLPRGKFARAESRSRSSAWLAPPHRLPEWRPQLFLQLFAPARSFRPSDASRYPGGPQGPRQLRFFKSS